MNNTLLIALGICMQFCFHASAQEWEILEQIIPADELDQITINHAAGHLFVLPSKSNNISVEVIGKCPGCSTTETENFKDGIRIIQRGKGKELVLTTHFAERLYFKEALNWVRKDKLNVEMILTIPAQLFCQLNLRKIHAEIHNVKNDIHLDIQNTRLLADEVGRVNINSEYCKVKINGAKEVIQEGRYTDIFTYDTEKVSFKADHAKFKTVNCGEVSYELTTGLIRSDSDSKVSLTGNRITAEFYDTVDSLEMTTSDTKIGAYNPGKFTSLQSYNGNAEFLLLDKAFITLKLDTENTEVFVHTEGAHTTLDLECDQTGLINEVTGGELNPVAEFEQEGEHFIQITGKMRRGKFILD